MSRRFSSVVLLFTLSAISLAGGNGLLAQASSGQIEKEVWGEADHKTVYLYTLANPAGMVVKITNYGGIITSVKVPDKHGIIEDVVLGFDNLSQYMEPNPCFGATIGRFANRIRDGRFRIDGTTYELVRNNGKHCIHGGNEFDRVVWDSEMVEGEESRSIRLQHVSKDGQNGFPGNLDVQVTYTLTNDNAIHIHFEAQTDKATHVNMTQHSYFNLTALKKPIYDHLVKIDADRFTEIDEDIVPTGTLSTVRGTDRDLTRMTRLGDNIHKLDHGGYHYCYVFNKSGRELKRVIEVLEPESGRTLQVTTTQPGVQFYTGNHISTDFTGKYGISYGPHSAFCLETEHLPDSPNHPNFPSTLLLPGERYDETVIYKFGVQND
jgi:aldose 1-epimerase